MKKILFRKLLTDCLLFFLIALISASIIIWVFQAVNYLDIMVEDGRDYLVYIKYSLLNFPKIITKIFPFALFFSFFYADAFTLYINGNGGFVGNYFNQTFLNSIINIHETISFYVLIILVIFFELNTFGTNFKIPHFPILPTHTFYKLNSINY